MTSSTASSTPPAWVAISGTISAMITATGVIIAGAFAYFKLIKGRTLHPRCSIAIDSQLVGTGKARALRISVTAKNEGQVALLFLSVAPQRLLISQADNTIWELASKLRQPVRWEESSIPLIRCGLALPEGILLNPPKEEQDLQDPPWWRWLTRRWLLQLLDGDKLEPGEQWARSVLVPVESNSIEAYLVRTEVSACRHVALRHVVGHQRRCCNTNSSHLTWSREVYILTEESHKNGNGSAVKASGI
jgi:hypothetical protein